MRNILLPLAAGALIVSSPVTLPDVAKAQSNNELMNLCKGLILDPPQPKDRGTLGECSSLFILFGIESDGLPTHVCDLWRERGELDDFGYDSFNDCVRGEHEFFRGG